MGFEHKEDLKELLPEYLDLLAEEGRIEHRGDNNYTCPFCNSGNGPNGTAAFHFIKTNPQRFKCLSCGKGGDIFHLVAFIESLPDEGEDSRWWPIRYNRTLKIMRPYIDMGIDFIKEKRTADRKNLNAPAAIPKEQENYKPYLRECYRNVSNTDYFAIRGLSQSIIDRFKLGYDSKLKCITIPYDIDPNKTGKCGGYVQRSIVDHQFYKHGKGFFNSAALYDNESEYVFIVEGQIDALSFEEIGLSAVSIGGTNGGNDLIEQLKARPTEKTLILALDNDKPGRKATGELIKALAENDITVKIVMDSSIYGTYKDANEFLIDDREGFKERMREWYTL